MHVMSSIISNRNDVIWGVCGPGAHAHVCLWALVFNFFMNEKS